jgi:hypothetical protein
MSNFLAVATVTATLGQVLQAAISTDVPGATVTTTRPDGPGARPAEVNIYLYQTTPNAAYRNADLPTRRSDGQVVQRPQAALNLHYLISFYGDESKLEPQRLLGSVVRTLHAQPVLTPGEIASTVAQNAGFLNGSNLAGQVERVRFTPMALSLEELSKLWSVFLQTSYVLSVAYEGSVVLIESDDTPQLALPVRDRNIYVLPFRQPLIQQVIASTGPDSPIIDGSSVIVLGEQLRGDVTQVIAAGAELTPAPQDVSNSQIRVTLPPDLRAGVQGLQVVQKMMMGTPPQPHRGIESNVAAFVLHPTITPAGASATDVTLSVAPKVRAGQRAVLMLNELSGDASGAYAFVPSPPTVDTSTLKIPISGVKSGDYLVRVQIDGAESPLVTDQSNRYVAPKVTVP